ncbi:Herc2 [Symbiodinium microadriaticum]|nr:Herc2 [Symbiodinium sp. KB8]CAE7649997.1 Herc2 [Symbiodinium microadriaticum]
MREATVCMHSVAVNFPVRSDQKRGLLTAEHEAARPQQAMRKCAALLLLVEVATSSLQLAEETLKFLDCQPGTESCEAEANLHLLQYRGRRVPADPSPDEAVPAAPAKIPMKGVSYGPSPFTSAQRNKHQDYFCDAAKPLWGDSGRGDLSIIRSLGANTVRLYGNDPELHHAGFLDHARSLGLDVVPGMGDKAFETVQCKGGNFSCSEGVVSAYKKNLENGFLLANRSYHPAIKYFIVVNEPELKLPSLNEPRKFAKAIATAIDGVLTAEEAMGVVGPKPNLTVTFSFASCKRCAQFGDRPGLGQLWTLRHALLHPDKYGIQAKHNLTDFFNTRFTYSFNSGNPSAEIQELFLKYYEEIFPHTPIFVAEYHNPGNPNLQGDLEDILSAAANSSLLLGISFFEFQNRYDQAGHLVWGMFDPQKDPGGKQRLKFEEFEAAVPCLSPIFDAGVRTIAEQLTAAYGGPGITPTRLCLPSPQEVVVSEHGFHQMVGLNNITAMQQFVKRVVEKLGGFVPYVVPKEFAELFLHPQTSYSDLEAMLVGHPQWARWDMFSACTVDRTALESTLGGKIGYVCGQGYADCSKIPDVCKKDVWDTASWVFGSHFREFLYASDETPKPLRHCYLDGAAQFVRSSIWKKSALRHECVVPMGWTDPNKVFITQNGFYHIWSDHDPVAMSIFIQRAVEHTGGKVLSRVPRRFVRHMLGLEASFKSLQAKLARRPTWAFWPAEAACVPDKAAKARDVGAAIGEVCSKGIFDCSGIPETCKGNVWDTAAFAFGSYYKALRQRSDKADPLYDCEFTGKGVFASPQLYSTFNLTKSCIVSAPTSADTNYN